MIKIALTVVTLLTLAGTGRAETFAFVDLSRVYSESSEAKRLAADVQADRETKQREVNGAATVAASARKAKAKDAADLQRRAEQLAKMDQDDLSKHQEVAEATIRQHVGDACAAVAKAHEVTILPIVPPYNVGPRDLTGEVLKLLNASDVAATAAENASLKARVAQLEAAQKTTPAPMSPKDAPKK